MRPAGKALITTKAIQPSEVLLSVPLAHCWTVAAAKACGPLAALGAEPLDAIAPESLLALHMLIVKAERARAEQTGAEPGPHSHHVECSAQAPSRHCGTGPRASFQP